MLHAIGLYIEIRETEKYGRVGKLPNLFELLLPWFAPVSTPESIYDITQEEYYATTLIDSAKGGSFRFENLLKHTALITSSLYDCKVAVSTGHLPPDKVRQPGNHYDVKMDRDIL